MPLYPYTVFICMIMKKYISIIRSFDNSYSNLIAHIIFINIFTTECLSSKELNHNYYIKAKAYEQIERHERDHIIFHYKPPYTMLPKGVFQILRLS